VGGRDRLPLLNKKEKEITPRGPVFEKVFSLEKLDAFGPSRRLRGVRRSVPKKKGFPASSNKRGGLNNFTVTPLERASLGGRPHGLS